MKLSEHEIHYDTQDIHYISVNYKRGNPLDDVFNYLIGKKKTQVTPIEIKKNSQYTFNVFSIEKIEFTKTKELDNFSFRMGIFLIRDNIINGISTCAKKPGYIIPKTFLINGNDLQEEGKFDLHIFSFPENCYTEITMPISVHLSFTTDI